MSTITRVVLADVTVDVIHEPQDAFPWRVIARGREIGGAFAQLAIAHARGARWWEWVA